MRLLLLVQQEKAVGAAEDRLLCVLDALLPGTCCDILHHPANSASCAAVWMA